MLSRVFGLFFGFALILQGATTSPTPPRRTGDTQGDRTLLPTAQWAHTPADSLRLPGRPVDLALSPDGTTLFCKENEGLRIIDRSNWKLKQFLTTPGNAGASLHGLAVSKDGRHVYFTDASSGLHIAEVDAAGKWSWKRSITLPKAKQGGPGYPCGIAIDRNELRAFVCMSRSNTLAQVDLLKDQVVREIPVGVAPYAVILPGEREALVTDWGGRLPGKLDKTSPSSGTPTLVDRRGVARSGGVTLIDLTDGSTEAYMETGRHASDLALSQDGGRLYVANANEDYISIIDMPKRRVIQKLSLLPGSIAQTTGVMPNALTLSPDGHTLYVACASLNAVAGVSLSGDKARLLGFLPTGWYPGALLARDKELIVANIKGAGSRGEAQDKVVPPAASGTGKKPANVEPGPAVRGHGVYSYQGTIDRIPFPAGAEWNRLTQMTLENSGTSTALGSSPVRKVKPVPVPKNIGEPSVIRHILYIIKENRTYDQLLGDIGKGDSEPSLCTFPRLVTPNHHALAEEFALLDNYYCSGVLSADGHSWATEGAVTDHLEQSFGGFTRSYTFGDDPLTYSASGFLWDAIIDHGLSFRNYGEMDYASTVPSKKFNDLLKARAGLINTVVYKHKIGVDRLKEYTSPDSIGWNMEIPDQIRADVFLRELKKASRSGVWPELTILYLPNDHTSGTTPGTPTPRAYLADNDLALGRVVEGISNSPFWKDTCIFVNEDDPQDGYDHVDGHRSICLVISPYARRKQVVKQFYSQSSVLHTIRQMLGVPPGNLLTAAAPLMTECFQPRPNLTPYRCRPASTPLSEVNPKLSALKGRARTRAEESLKLRFDAPDLGGDETLNRILWEAMRGNAPYPEEFEGAHGRGLRARGLKLAE